MQEVSGNWPEHFSVSTWEVVESLGASVSVLPLVELLLDVDVRHRLDVCKTNTSSILKTWTYVNFTIPPG